jgi:hypothetical protein
MPATNQDAGISDLGCHPNRGSSVPLPSQTSDNGLRRSLAKAWLVLLVCVVIVLAAILVSRYRTAERQAALDRKLQKVVNLYGLRPLSIRRYEADPKWKTRTSSFLRPGLER